ncbi:MAG: sodium:proton antiporter, partial [Clostridia bacterium]|nr:sodium:proton antiporter [Clostridia bacterium]
NIDSLRLQLSSLPHPLPISVRTVIVLLMVGLGIKSGLFPFHSWIPDAYSYSTPASGALLSSFISKGYIFLLIKVVVRIFGLDMIRASGVCPVIFAFGAAGIIMGSVSATRQTDIRRMVAFSSVAQIGYIYMGIGMCTRESLIAALFHMAVHSFAKSMLFSSAASLIASSGDRAQMDSLAGSGRRNVPAGIAFTIGAMSLTGVPLLGGFLSKIYLSQAAIAIDTFHAVAVLLTLALSTFLQTVYFLHAVVNIYRPGDKNVHAEKQSVLSGAALCVMALMNILLGTASVPLYRALVSGFLRF